jgi:hypothetical protein
MNSAVVLPESIQRRIKALPRRLSRRQIAKEFKEEFGVEYSHRTIEARPYAWKIINGQATADTEEAFTDEYLRISASPEYRTKRAPAAKAAPAAT